MKLIKILSLFLYIFLSLSKVQASEISEYYKLKNGMEVLLIKDDRIPLVTHTIWYRVGAIDDPQGKSGIAHFLEHMMFKRFASYEVGEYVREVEKNGGLYNAFTGPYYTAYYATLPSNRLELIMGLESQRMTKLKLKEKDQNEFEKEKLVVLDERKRRTDNIPVAKLLEQMTYYNYKNNRFSIPIIGWQSEIKSINLGDMRSFYSKYYAPNNSILVIAGNFNIDKTKKLIEKHYGHIDKKVTKNIPKYSPVDTSLVKAKFNLSDPKATDMVFHFYNYKPITRENYVESYMINCLATIVANSKNSRLYSELVENKNILESINASIYCSPYHPCRVLISAEKKTNKSLKEGSKAIAEVLNSIAERGITEEELQLAKAVEKYNMHKILYGSLSEKAGMYGMLLLENYTIQEIEAIKGNYNKDIDSITREQVNLMARNIFNKNYIKGYLQKSNN
jgi:zinc protease